MNEITIDANGCVRVTAGGFATLDEAELFAREFWSAVLTTHTRIGRLRALIDSRNVGVQPGPVVAKFDPLMKKIASLTDIRVAIVLTSSLLKLQFKRALPGSDFMTFLSTNAAMTWLMAYD